MMRRLALVIVAACSSGAAPAPAPVLAVHPRPPQRAVHGAHIEITAVTDDASAAVTQDVFGGTRLWPSLDGRLEPVVVRTAAARELALGRDGTGFVIATLDAAGELELIRVAATGEVRSRVQIAGDVQIDQLAMTRRGVLALRADQTVALIAPTGIELARVAPPRGEQIVSLLARGDHAIALLRHGTVYARSIDVRAPCPAISAAEGRCGSIDVRAPCPAISAVEGRCGSIDVRAPCPAISAVEGRCGSIDVRAPCPAISAAEGRCGSIDVDQASWGAASPALAIDPSHVVLSPDGTHVAAAASGSVAVVELATGHAGTPTCLVAQLEDALQRQIDRTSIPLGFVDNSTVACFAFRAVTWWGVDGTAKQRRVGVATVPELVGVGDGLVVTADRESLLLTTAGGQQALGYRLADPRQVYVSPAGLTLSVGDGRPVLVDRDLHLRKELAIPNDGEGLDEVLPLDDRHALVGYSDTRGATRLHRISLVETSLQTTIQTLDIESLTYDIRYEPATHLLAVTEPASIAFVELDPATLTFGAASRIESAGDIQLTDPALADGIIALVLRADAGRVSVAEVRREGLLRRALAVAQAYVVQGEFAAVDRAGHLYVIDGTDVTMYGSNGKRLASLAVRGRSIVRPSPDGAAFVVLGDNQIRMFDATGTERWSQPAPLAADVGWIDGAPYAWFPGGITKLDPRSGERTARACGWTFGLSSTSFDNASDSHSVCDEE